MEYLRALFLVFCFSLFYISGWDQPGQIHLLLICLNQKFIRNPVPPLFVCAGQLVTLKPLPWFSVPHSRCFVLSSLSFSRLIMPSCLSRPCEHVVLVSFSFYGFVFFLLSVWMYVWALPVVSPLPGLTGRKGGYLTWVLPLKCHLKVVSHPPYSAKMF